MVDCCLLDVVYGEIKKRYEWVGSREGVGMGMGMDDDGADGIRHWARRLGDVKGSASITSSHSARNIFDACLDRMVCYRYLQYYNVGEC